MHNNIFFLLVLINNKFMYSAKSTYSPWQLPLNITGNEKLKEKKTGLSLFHFTAYTSISFQHSFLSGLISVIRKAVNRWTMCRRQRCNVYCWSWRQEEMCALKMANRQILGTATFNNDVFSCQTRVTTWLFENLMPNDLNVLQSNLQDRKHVKYVWLFIVS